MNEDKSQPQHQNPQVSCLHFQLSENQALLTPSRRCRWRGHPLPPGAQVHPPLHFTPLKRLCPNCQRRVSNKALPENGSETLCNECRSRFQKGQHPAKRRVLSDTPQALPGRSPSAHLPKHALVGRWTLTCLRGLCTFSGDPAYSHRALEGGALCGRFGMACPSWMTQPD